ncbi:4055_t:CDS:10 [Diversispora eburnea]|uniref:Diphthine--ammonia ligase n=1 Tax=Diversispora eburnea TaxID=1213867 RepID=A0A9N9A1J5_9GLOM|nr:4055_t:CDS:10 [Diversispora eburnea]
MANSIVPILERQQILQNLIEEHVMTHLDNYLLLRPSTNYNNNNNNYINPSNLINFNNNYINPSNNILYVDNNSNLVNFNNFNNSSNLINFNNNNRIIPCINPSNNNNNISNVVYFDNLSQECPSPKRVLNQKLSELIDQEESFTRDMNITEIDISMISISREIFNPDTIHHFTDTLSISLDIIILCDYIKKLPQSKDYRIERVKEFKMAVGYFWAKKYEIINPDAKDFTWILQKSKIPIPKELSQFSFTIYNREESTLSNLSDDFSPPTNNHQIIALANLKPCSSSKEDEIDSYLYQTVGHEAIKYYSECMNLPLYRQEISGNSLIQTSDYKETSGDETEDLFNLLKNVKENHPEIKGVSVGAILSNYQRIRVEHVCNRLGLVSLAYLWRRNQKELLSEMINSGINAILIKIAAIGLEIKHLGKSIEEIKETETIIHSDDAFAKVAYLHLKKLMLEDKPKNEIIMMNNPININMIKIPSWEDDVKDFIDAGKNWINENEFKSSIFPIIIDYFPKEEKIFNDNYMIYSNPPYFSISGITAYYKDYSQEQQLPFDSIEEETNMCMLNIQDWSDVMNMNVFIKNMNDFVKMNNVYKTFFDINPPARACVGSNLPSPIRIQIDLIAIKSSSLLLLPLDDDNNENKGIIKKNNFNKPMETMHVQSISYWAPANIGPYSQTKIVILYIAVPALPKWGKIEWQVLIHDCKNNDCDNKDNISKEPLIYEGIKSIIKMEFQPSSPKFSITLIPVLSIIDNNALGICVHGIFH